MVKQGQTGGRRTRKANMWAKAAGEYYRSHKNDPKIKEFSDVLKSPDFKKYYLSKYKGKGKGSQTKFTRKQKKFSKYQKGEPEEEIQEEGQEENKNEDMIEENSEPMKMSKKRKGKKSLKKSQSKEEDNDWKWGGKKMGGKAPISGGEDGDEEPASTTPLGQTELVGTAPDTQVQGQ